MEQCLFDEIMLFVLETVSSQEYLNSLGIYRPASINWDKFKSKVNKQTIKPGIYPRSFGIRSVHYYGVRREPDGTLTVANGYPTVASLNKKYAVGLNTQPDHSHGLCQTFALMYYFNKEGELIPGAYYDNVIIGLKFLLKFIKEDYYNRERCWKLNDIINNMNPTGLCQNHSYEDRLANLKNLKSKNSNQLCLTDLIQKILSPKFEQNLKTWFFE
jgi:hypothetical protein